ncbi:hypothetical protein ACR820_13745 [Streptomyces netropsis]
MGVGRSGPDVLAAGKAPEEAFVFVIGACDDQCSADVSSRQLSRRDMLDLAVEFLGLVGCHGGVIRMLSRYGRPTPPAT